MLGRKRQGFGVRGGANKRHKPRCHRRSRPPLFIQTWEIVASKLQNFRPADVIVRQTLALPALTCWRLKGFISPVPSPSAFPANWHVAWLDISRCKESKDAGPAGTAVSPYSKGFRSLRADYWADAGLLMMAT